MNPSDSAAKPLALPSAAPGETAPARGGPLVPSMVHHSGDSGAQLPPGLTGTPTFESLVQALRRRWLLAVSLAVMGAGLAVAAVLFFMPAKYAAQVRLHVASRGDARMFGEGNDDPDFLLFKK